MDIQRTLMDRYKSLLDEALKHKFLPEGAAAQLRECRTACEISGIDEAALEHEWSVRHTK